MDTTQFEAAVKVFRAIRALEARDPDTDDVVLIALDLLGHLSLEEVELAMSLTGDDLGAVLDFVDADEIRRERN